MASPLLTGLALSFSLSEASGNRANRVSGAPALVDHGSVAQGAGAIGASPKAASFSGGGSDYLELQASAFDFTGTFTVAACYVHDANGGFTAIAGQGWQGGTADTNLLIVHNGGELHFYLNRGASNQYVTSTNGAAGSGATMFVARHDAASKKICLTVRQKGSADNEVYGQDRTYTGALARSSMPIRVGQLSDGGMPLQGRVQELNVWGRYLSDEETLAWINGGDGDVHPFSTCYPEPGSSPGIDTSPRCSILTLRQNLQPVPNQPLAASMPLTSRGSIRPEKPVLEPCFRFVNATANNPGSENQNASDNGPLAIEMAYWRLGMVAPVPMLVKNGSGAYSKVVAVGSFADWVLPETMWPFRDVYVYTYASSPSGKAKLPMAMSNQRGGYAPGKNFASVDPSDFGSSSGGYIPGPCQVYGRTAGSALVKDRDLVLKSDSNAASEATYPHKLMVAAGVKAMEVALPGEGAVSLVPDGADTARSALAADCDHVWWRYFTNDLRDGPVAGKGTYAQAISNMSTSLKLFLSGVSKTKKLLISTTMPMTETSASTAPRGQVNEFLRSGCTSQQMSDITGRPALIKRWNGSALVSSDQRGTGAGDPLDVTIQDDGAIIEDNPSVNNNVWNTTAGPGKAVASPAVVSEKIHTDDQTATGMQAVLQPRFSAWLADPPPVPPPSLASVTVSLSGPDAQGRYVATATGAPSGADLSGGSFSQDGGGSFSANQGGAQPSGVSTPPAKGPSPKTVTVAYSKGAVTGSASYQVPAGMPSEAEQAQQENAGALQAVQVTASAPDGQGRVQLTASPYPATASLGTIAWSVVTNEGGTVTSSGLLSPPAAGSSLKGVGVRAQSSNGSSGSYYYVVQPTGATSGGYGTLGQNYDLYSYRQVPAGSISSPTLSITKPGGVTEDKTPSLVDGSSDRRLFYAGYQFASHGVHILRWQADYQAASGQPTLHFFENGQFPVTWLSTYQLVLDRLQLAEGQVSKRLLTETIAATMEYWLSCLAEPIPSYEGLGASYGAIFDTAMSSVVGLAAAQFSPTSQLVTGEISAITEGPDRLQYYRKYAAITLGDAELAALNQAWALLQAIPAVAAWASAKAATWQVFATAGSRLGLRRGAPYDPANPLLGFCEDYSTCLVQLAARRR